MCDCHDDGRLHLRPLRPPQAEDDVGVPHGRLRVGLMQGVNVWQDLVRAVPTIVTNTRSLIRGRLGCYD